MVDLSSLAVVAALFLGDEPAVGVDADTVLWSLAPVHRPAVPDLGADPWPTGDVDRDYSSVNAALVRRYAGTDRSALLESLAASARELTAFLRTIEPGAWDRDFGVRHEGETLTVESTVDDLIADYDHHRVQLEEFRASAV